LKQKRANGEGLVFSFRGTSGLRDLIPDVQLALNMKKVGRLEEAKQFVNEVMKENPQIKDKDMDMYGHSLGGLKRETVLVFFFFFFFFFFFTRKNRFHCRRCSIVSSRFPFVVVFVLRMLKWRMEKVLVLSSFPPERLV
jgi:hypothetical protein